MSPRPDMVSVAFIEPILQKCRKTAIARQRERVSKAARRQERRAATKGFSCWPQTISKRRLRNRPVFYLFEDGDEFVHLGAIEDAFDALVVDEGVGRFVEAGGVHHAVGGEVFHDFF